MRPWNNVCNEALSVALISAPECPSTLTVANDIGPLLGYNQPARKLRIRADIGQLCDDTG